jgi:glycosyltransferase involved in cell wall biosynthesis
MQLSKLSIVVCTYNRDKFIAECLLCLSKQTLSNNNFEVIIIDNSSTDNTAKIVKDFISKHPDLSYRYIYEAKKGLSFARNRGIEESIHDIITFIDDDAEAVPVFAEKILLFLQLHPKAAGIGGKVIPKYSETEEPVWMSKYLNGYVGKVDNGDHVRVFEGDMKYPIGCNMTYRKELMLQAGGFNNQLTFRGDDKHIYYAVASINNKIYYLPEALLYHNIDKERLSFINFKKLFLKTGNEERIRVKTEIGNIAVVKKFFEYLFKLGASFLLWFYFIIKRKGIKGRYVMYSQWFTLLGFFKKVVFVR